MRLNSSRLGDEYTISDVSGLSDVTITSVADKDILQFDSGTNMWVNVPFATFEATIDHNALDNLAVGDVHTQYLPVDGTRAMEDSLLFTAGSGYDIMIEDGSSQQRLTLKGNLTSGAADGGIIRLLGGTAIGTGDGGPISIQGGLTSVGVEGIISIGTSSGSALNLARAGIDTNIFGDLVMGSNDITGVINVIFPVAGFINPVDAVGVTGFSLTITGGANPAQSQNGGDLILSGGIGATGGDLLIDAGDGLAIDGFIKIGGTLGFIEIGRTNVVTNILGDLKVTDHVGIGATPGISNALFISETFTFTSGVPTGIFYNGFVTPTGSSTANYRGLRISNIATGANNITGSVDGFFIDSGSAMTGDLTLLIGGDIVTRNFGASGTDAEQITLRLQTQKTGAKTVTTTSPLHILAPTNSAGNIGSYASIIIEDPSSLPNTSTILSIDVKGGKCFFGGEVEIDGAFNHDGSTFGIYSATPVVRPAAYTQTFATADRTLDAYTADVENVAYVAASGMDDRAMLIDLNFLRVAYENLRAFTEDAVAMLNSVVDDFQANGHFQ